MQKIETFLPGDGGWVGEVRGQVDGEARSWGPDIGGRGLGYQGSRAGGTQINQIKHVHG
jgi:hypothetical protein